MSLGGGRGSGNCKREGVRQRNSTCPRGVGQGREEGGRCRNVKKWAAGRLRGNGRAMGSGSTDGAAGSC